MSTDRVSLADLIGEFGGLAFALDARAPEDVSAIGPEDGRLAQVFPSDVQIHSGSIRGGELFAALPGFRVDGWRYIPNAFARGARAALSVADRSLPDLRRRCLQKGVPIGGRFVWVHPRASAIVGSVASVVHGRPTDRLKLFGVTGTNGKTSVCHLAGQVMRHAGLRPAVIGTAGHTIYSAGGPRLVPATHTTPDAPELQRLFARHVDGGGDAGVMEVSSHALMQERVEGIAFAAAAFTNLTREHLDYHRSMERYLHAKARIWDHVEEDGAAIVHGSSGASLRMRGLAEAAGCRLVTVDIDREADLVARDLEPTAEGVRFTLDGLGVEARAVRLLLRGRHNVENALVAGALALAAGADPGRVVDGLERAVAAPGRLERVRRSDDGADGASAFEVLVDYAHSPDAIERVLRGLRRDVTGDGRVICVFGCGGDRDRGKRPLMGRAAARFADVSVITSDNPRTEDPGAIADAVATGFEGEPGRHIVELDRRRAIERAVDIARPGDVVLIAGKGHENTQDLGDRTVAFDDRVVAAEVLGTRAVTAGEEEHA